MRGPHFLVSVSQMVVAGMVAVAAVAAVLLVVVVVVVVVCESALLALDIAVSDFVSVDGQLSGREPRSYVSPNRQGGSSRQKPSCRGNPVSCDHLRRTPRIDCGALAGSRPSRDLTFDTSRTGKETVPSEDISSGGGQSGRTASSG